ncbi:MAG TPA: hypothetical protein VFG50_01190 [Rhodothermales bacterium]|nr:hypothetical protein [Rhodothermales bacterium]
MAIPDYAEAYDEWQCDFPLRGLALFEALADSFSFDDLMSAADRLEIPSLEAVEHLRIMMREQMVQLTRIRFSKMGTRPAYNRNALR